MSEDRAEMPDTAARRVLRTARHPLFALAGAVLFAVAAMMAIRGGLNVRARAGETDPVKISDRALDRVFDREVAEREIRAALAAGDTDLAQSFVALADDRGVAIAPALKDDVAAAAARDATASNTAGRFVH